MADYIGQPNFSQPTRGQNEITHRVQVFNAAAQGVLQTNINNFLDGLKALPETPQILGVEFSTGLQGGNVLYTALIWYVLIG